MAPPVFRLSSFIRFFFNLITVVALSSQVHLHAGYPPEVDQFRKGIAKIIQAPEEVVIVIPAKDLPIQVEGSKEAEVIVIEFFDFQCPLCKVFHENALKKIKKKFVKPGQVRFYSANFPLEKNPSHSFARRAAEANVSAGIQGKYWEMQSLLFKYNDQLSEGSLFRIAGILNLDEEQFYTDMETTAVVTLNKEIAKARKINVTGTPTILIGRQFDDGTVVALPFKGKQTYTKYEKFIELMLNLKRK